MAAIHYLSEHDKIKTFDTYKPVVMDLHEADLRVLILMVLNGADVEYAFDIVMGNQKKD